MRLNPKPLKTTKQGKIVTILCIEFDKVAKRKRGMLLNQRMKYIRGKFTVLCRNKI